MNKSFFTDIFIGPLTWTVDISGLLILHGDWITVHWFGIGNGFGSYIVSPQWLECGRNRFCVGWITMTISEARCYGRRSTYIFFYEKAEITSDPVQTVSLLALMTLRGFFREKQSWSHSLESAPPPIFFKIFSNSGNPWERWMRSSNFLIAEDPSFELK